MMEHLTLDVRKQIQLDNETYPNHVLIYKNGQNYCTYNKGAMQLICCFREYPYIIEYLDFFGNGDLIQITFSPVAFECMKKKYKAVALSPNRSDLTRWLIFIQHSISDYNYYIWSNILNIELRMPRKKSKNVKYKVI
jgi:hypothetical protein